MYETYCITCYEQEKKEEKYVCTFNCEKVNIEMKSAEKEEGKKRKENMRRRHLDKNMRKGKSTRERSRLSMWERQGDQPMKGVWSM